MTFRREFTTLLPMLFLAVLMPACGSSPSDPAPTASNLSCSPTTVPTGTQSTIKCTFAFMDSDGDVQSVDLSLTPPGAGPQTAPPSQLQASGQDNGQVSVELAMQPALPGPYLLDLWVIDTEGKDSNKLSTTVTAQ